MSAYNYFCLSCAEGGVQCEEDDAKRAQVVADNARLPRDARGVLLAKPQLSCPEMSLVDYTVAAGGNYYVRRLATTREDGYASRAGGRMGAPDLALALERLRSPGMLVVFTEELSGAAIGDLSRCNGLPRRPEPPQ